MIPLPAEIVENLDKLQETIAKFELAFAALQQALNSLSKTSSDERAFLHLSFAELLRALISVYLLCHGIESKDVALLLVEEKISRSKERVGSLILGRKQRQRNMTSLFPINNERTVPKALEKKLISGRVVAKRKEKIDEAVEVPSTEDLWTNEPITTTKKRKKGKNGEEKRRNDPALGFLKNALSQIDR